MLTAQSLLFIISSLCLSWSLSIPKRGEAPLRSLSIEEIASFKPYTLFASTAYCSPPIINAWSCGEKCNLNAGFTPVASGGDGVDVQYWYVGYSPLLQTIIVAHEGTDLTKGKPGFTDADIRLQSLDPSLFPNLPSGIQIHSGFKRAHSSTAYTILGAVNRAMHDFNTSSVTLTGHSLGAVLSILEAIFLRLHLPPKASLKVVGYGTPRIGNQAFADYIDANIPNLTRINNKKDIVPIIPGRFFGYRHPSGEIHIKEFPDHSTPWITCPGQDNPSNQCSRGDVDTLFNGVPADHSGPFDGVTMAC